MINFQLPTETSKYRFLQQHYNDRDKADMVHDSSAIRTSSTRVMLSIARIQDSLTISHEATQAYTQRKDKLTRKVFCAYM